jgi:hypothetical protein
MKIFYPTINLIPSSDKIIDLVKKGHLVIELPKVELTTDKEVKLISGLKENLPKSYSVFKSGVWKETITITVKLTVTKEDILSNINVIEECVTDYITISNKLINNEKCDKKVTQNWQLIEEHGEHNRYRHKTSGQILETNSYPFDKIIDIDPYFFGIFVKTSLKYADIKKIILDEFHDSDKILNFITNNSK